MSSVTLLLSLYNLNLPHRVLENQPCVKNPPVTSLRWSCWTQYNVDWTYRPESLELSSYTVCDVTDNWWWTHIRTTDATFDETDMGWVISNSRHRWSSWLANQPPPWHCCYMIMVTLWNHGFWVPFWFSPSVCTLDREKTIIWVFIYGCLPIRIFFYFDCCASLADGLRGKSYSCWYVSKVRRMTLSYSTVFHLIP